MPVHQLGRRSFLKAAGAQLEGGTAALRTARHAPRAAAERPADFPGLRAGPGAVLGNQAIQRLLSGRTVQAKVTINAPGDASEQEADRVAERVMRLPSSASTSPAPSGLRAAPAAKAQVAPAAKAQTAPPAVDRALSSPGEPLDTTTRSFMERGFGYDFSRVRVHTDAAAAESARAVAAVAYTVGRDVVFSAGRYDRATDAGRLLLAHELAHVVQQAAPDGAAGALQRQADIDQAPPGLACTLVTGMGRPTGTDVMFDVSSSALSPTQKVAITNFMKAWTAGGSKDDVQVDGYASRGGPQALNWRLSCQRAEAVKAELVRRGIPAAKVAVVAHGETDEFSTTALSPNGRAIISSFAPVPPPAPPGLCPKVPTTTPATCLDRHLGYCAAAACFPADPWLSCVCMTSGQICDAVEAFHLRGVEGGQLEMCINANAEGLRGIGIKMRTGHKGNWILNTNRCIWGDWRAALDPLHDPTLPVPSGLTAEWVAAVSVCRTKGVDSADCCQAEVAAEQHAIDGCGPYSSSQFGLLPYDIPGSPLCSFVVRQFAPTPLFTGDFGKVADRIAYGNERCCST